MGRRYDHRIRNAIVRSKDPDLFPELEIPKSTKRDWFRKGCVDVVTVGDFDFSFEELVLENRQLKAELVEARASRDLITETTAIAGFQLQYRRLPSCDVKSKLIAAIQKAAKVVPITKCLELIQLSGPRFYAWLARQRQCQLDDYSSCPRLSPNQLLPEEVGKIKGMVTDPIYSHFSISSLSLYAAKTSVVVASLSTWSRIIDQFGLKRPGKRLYPPKPKVGVRASSPCQIWHVDMSVIKLVCGTRCYIQAVIDNFSRYVLAWKVSQSYGGEHTKSLILQAIEKAQSFVYELVPEVYFDSGSENINDDVDTLISAGTIRQTIAQIMVDFSNGMIEALFHRLKHRHLYTLNLTSFSVLEKQTTFYLTQANDVIPLRCLKGATPLECISGKWTESELAWHTNQQMAAKQHRLTANREKACVVCCP